MKLVVVVRLVVKLSLKLLQLSLMTVVVANMRLSRVLVELQWLEGNLPLQLQLPLMKLPVVVANLRLPRVVPWMELRRVVPWMELRRVMELRLA